MDAVVGGATGGEQGDDGVDDALFVDDFRQWCVVPAQCRDPAQALGGGDRELFPQGVPGGSKAAPGTCRPIASSSIWLLLAVP